MAVYAFVKKKCEKENEKFTRHGCHKKNFFSKEISQTQMHFLKCEVEKISHQHQLVCFFTCIQKRKKEIA
jgi:hypothetical protein